MTQLEIGSLQRGVEKDLVGPGSGPDGGPTIHQCSKDLLRKGWAKKMPDLRLAHPELVPGAFNPGKDGKPRGPLYSDKDPYNSPMTELSSRLDRKFKKLRVDFHEDSKWGAYITAKTERVKAIVEAITTSRREDTSSFLRKQVKEDIKAKLKDPDKPSKGEIHRYGLGLKGDKEHLVVSTERESDLKPVNHYSRNWDDIDIARTMQNAWGDAEVRERLQEVGYKRAGDLLEWADNLGDPNGRMSGRYTELNKTHFRVAKVFKTALDRLNKTPKQLKEC